MTIDETTRLLAEISIAYPRFSQRLTHDEALIARGLWHAALRDYSSAEVNSAMRQLLRELVYPPTIADICRRIESAKNARLQVEIDECWLQLAKAARNGLYHAEQEYAKLPDVCKQYIKTPSGLRKLADTDESTLENTTRKAFSEYAANHIAGPYARLESPKPAITSGELCLNTTR